MSWLNSSFAISKTPSRDGLKRRAVRHGRSMEEEVRDILRNAAKEENRPLPNLGSRIAARFAKTGLSDDLPELRGQAPRPAEIGK
jgi:plasmid stability protein